MDPQVITHTLYYYNYVVKLYRDGDVEMHFFYFLLVRRDLSAKSLLGRGNLGIKASRFQGAKRRCEVNFYSFQDLELSIKIA